MRILIYHEDPRSPERDGQGGGAESLMHDLREGLRRIGHEAEIVRDPDLPRIVDDWAPDVVHVGTIHNFIGLDPIRWLQAERVPHLWSLMDYYPFCASRMMLVNNDQSCSGVQGVCAHECGQYAPPGFVELVNRSYHCAYNPYTAAIYRRHGLRCDAVVALGVDTDRFAPDPAQRTPTPSIYTSSAWAAWPTKGMHILQAALKDKPYGAHLLTNLPRAAVASELKKAHIYVYPSCYEETWGLCLCEAMASGCACITTDVAGAKAQIVDGVSGLIVPKRDARALGAAMDRLLADADLRERLGHAAREKAAAHYSLEAMARRWEAIYRQAIVWTANRACGSGCTAPEPIPPSTLTSAPAS